jgi:tape measure domain-containing protein
MSLDEEININIFAPGADETDAKVKKVTRDLEALGVTYQKTSAKIKSSPLGLGDSELTASNFTKAAQGLDAYGNAAKGAGEKVKGAKSSVDLFTAAITIGAITGVVHELLDLSNAYGDIQNKVSTVTTSQGEMNVVTERLLKIANDSRVSLEQVANLYTRSARALEGFGKSAEDVLRFTDALTKALRVSGATTIETKNAILQLEHGLSSGTLRGRQLNSVLTQTPALAKLIADKVSNGDVGALRGLGAKNKLTTDVIFDAAIEGADKLDRQLAKTVPTIAQAGTVLHNNLIVEMGKFTDSSGAVAGIILDLANHLDNLIPIVEALASVIVTLLVQKAINLAIDAMKELVIAIAANPWMALAEAILIVVAALAPFIANMQVSKDSVVTFGDLAVSAWQEFTSQIIGSNKETETFAGTLEDLSAKVEAQIKQWEQWADKIVFAVSIFSQLASLNLGGAVADISLRINRPEDPMASVTQNVINRARRRAEDRTDDTMVSDAERMIAESRLSDKGDKGPHSVTGAKEHGKSFAEILMKTQQEEWLDAQPKYIQEIDKELMQRLGQLKPSAFANLTGEQVDMLRDTITRANEMKDALKLAEDISKDLNKIKEEQNKKSAEAGKHAGENERKSRLDLQKSDVDVESQINPLIKYNEELEKLQQFAERYPEQADLVSKKILEMNAAYTQFAPIFQQLSDSIADAAANAIIFGDSLSKALQQIAKQAASQIIAQAIKLGISYLTGAPLPGIGSASPIPIGTATGAPLVGHASGGYTGDGGTNDIAGYVHGREMVINAKQTARYRPMLEAINAGGSPGAGGGVNVQVHNYAGVDVQTEQLSRGEVSIMIKRGVQEHAPKVISGDLRNPNSATSKAMNRHIESTRRR